MAIPGLEQTLYICSAISTIAAAISVIALFIGRLKRPEQTQNERLAALEKSIEKFKTYFDNDNRRIASIEEGNRVTQKALLALMSHALNGNDIEHLQEAKNELEKYLIER